MAEKPDLTHFDITVEIPKIQITVSAKDPLDAVMFAGEIVAVFRKHNFEPKVVILP